MRDPRRTRATWSRAARAAWWVGVVALWFSPYLGLALLTTVIGFGVGVWYMLRHPGRRHPRFRRKGSTAYMAWQMPSPTRTSRPFERDDPT